MIPVILSGGSGTRLWPVSRTSYPKQFCEFYDQSFLRNSIERLKPLGEPRVLTVKSMEPLTYRALVECGLSGEEAIYEPLGKNTAPAIALMCHYLNMQGQTEEVAGVFPADHLINDDETFRKAVKLGVDVAQQGSVVTIGITPRNASTGYGYIEIKPSAVVAEAYGLKARPVEGFREKPDEATANRFLDSGIHYWNAGMFIFKVSTMIDHFKALMPDLWNRVSTIRPDFGNAKAVYANLASMSIDYGIMEKLDDLACIPCDIGWSDVGSWDELARLSEENSRLHFDSHVELFTQDARSNFVFSIRDKVIGLIDVEDLIVVDTPDAMLVARKGCTQKVKPLVEKIRGAGLPVATEHPFEMRPWGGYEVISDEKDYKAKKITVDPGAQLSYQSHKRRSEHWTIVSGEALVILNDENHPLKAGQSINIPQGAKHRIKNTGHQPLVFVEVQTGSYFGEDDIVRYEDDYNRV